MPAYNIYPLDEVVAALHKSKGIKSIAAKLIGCSVRTLDNYANKYPEVAEAIAEERAQLVGMAVLGLIHHVKAKDLRACMFVLETIGKNDGWARRQELTGANGGPLAVTAVTYTIVHPDGTTTHGNSGTGAQPYLNGANHSEPGGDAQQQDV